ncbi:hypothetical protein [Streptomyces sp. NPDC001450]
MAIFSSLMPAKRRDHGNDSSGHDSSRHGNRHDHGSGHGDRHGHGDRNGHGHGHNGH